MKIEILKAAAALANKDYNDEKDRLAAMGLKSQERYVILKPLKEAADAAHAEYVKFAHGQIKTELNKIIAADTPNRQAAARSRSAWKMAKYNASK